ncbi:hypothetical protein ACFLWK_00110 [Chloroflexota bacterium]
MNKGMKAGEEKQEPAARDTGGIPGKCHRGERDKTVTGKRYSD